MLPNQQPPQGPMPTPAQGAPAAPPPAAGPMPPQGMPPQTPQQPMVSGEDVQGLLFSRLETLTEQEMQAFDEVITEETIPVLIKLLPELAILFEEAMKVKSGGGSEDMEEGGYEEGGEYAEETDDEEQNPLVNDNLSKGLMGR